MAGDCFVFKFLRRSVNGKHLMRFQSENAVFIFFRSGVDGLHFHQTIPYDRRDFSVKLESTGFVIVLVCVTDFKTI